MNELHLFAGAGGGILGGMLLGHTCVCAVEIEPYRQKDLLARQRDGILPKFPIWDDVKTFDGKPWRGLADIVCGGFPCQDISAAGKGAGIEGEQSGLWTEMARIIREVQPPFVFVENSPMLTVRGIDRVLGDLAAMGYDARWGVLSAADAIWLSGTPCLDHLRERIWIIGKNTNTECVRRDTRFREQERQQFGGRWQARSIAPASGEDVPISNASRIQQRRPEQWPERERTRSRGESNGDADGSGRNKPKPIEEFSLNQNGASATLERQGRRITRAIGSASEEDADSYRPRLEKQRSAITDGTELETVERRSWWSVEPGMG